MPNWCDNLLTVSLHGPSPAAIDQHRAFTARLLLPRAIDLAAPVELLQTFLPVPGKYVETVGGHPRTAADDGLTWYDWQCDHWGVKWGDGKTAVVDHVPDERLILRFVTPWGPPTEGLRRISEEYPLLLFWSAWSEESPSCGSDLILNGVVGP